MHRLSVVVVGVVAASLVSCTKEVDQTCGGETCSETQFCNKDTRSCIDDERPQVQLDGASDVVTTELVTMTGRVTDDVEVVSAEWFLSVDQPRPLELDAEGRFSVQVQVPALDAAQVPFSVRAKDRLGATLISTQLIVDRVAPVITVVAPVGGQVFSTGSFEAKVKATDGSNSLSALIIGGKTVASPRSGEEATQQLTVDGNFDREATTVGVEAVDTRGNRSTQQFEVLIDNVAPVVTLTTPASDVVISVPMYEAVAAVSDGSALTVEFQLGSDPAVAATMSAAGVWSARLPIPSVNRADAISVTAIDALGNRTTASRPIRIDRTPVMLTITAPAADSIHRSDLTVSITTEADVDFVTASFGSAPVPLTKSGTTTWSGTLPVPAGDFTPRTITVFARDEQMNDGTATVAVKTDTVAPVITITSPTAAQKFKASDFPSGNTLNVTWTVTDGDSAAATTSVDGAPFTGTSTTVTTAATDNGVSYNRAIEARDSAGNTATASVQFSVDRVAPTVTSWTPASGTRNIVNGSTVITFSEPVQGPGLNDAPFSIVGQPTPGGTWNGSRTEFTMSLATFIYKALDFSTLAAFTDSYGNPVVAQSKKLHTATSLSSTDVATGVTAFRAASDSDGILTVLTFHNCSGIGCQPVRLWRDNGGALAGIRSGQGLGLQSLNVWNTVNPTTLVSTPAYGAAMSAVGGTLRWWDGGNDNVAVGGVPVSRTPEANEVLVGATAAIGHVTGSTYSRATYSRVLQVSGARHVVQSTTHLSFIEDAAAGIRYARQWCRPPFSQFGASCMDVLMTVANSANPTDFNAVSTLDGSCEAMSFTSGSLRQYLFFAKPGYEGVSPAPAVTPQTLVPDTRTTTYAASFRLGSYTWAGQSSLIYAELIPSQGIFPALRIRKLSGCSAFPETTIVEGGSVSDSSLTNTTLVQVGKNVGLLKLDTATNTLKLSVYPVN